MLIRTLRSCTLRDRDIKAGLCLDLPDGEAQAMIDGGDAELWTPVERQRVPNAYLDAPPPPPPAARAAPRVAEPKE